MYEGRLDKRASLEDVLYFLRSDVLSLIELEDVLLPVDQLERIAFYDHPNVSSVQPASLICYFLRLLWLLEVA